MWYCFISLMIFFSSFSSESDSVDFVFSSPSGNYILFDWDISENMPDRTNLVIERSIAGQNNFHEIGRFLPVQSYDAFEAMVGKDFAESFAGHIHATNEEEVMKKLNNPGSGEDFGLYVFNIHLLRAAGFVFLDAIVPDENTNYEYRISLHNTILKQQKAKKITPADLPTGKVKQLYTTDSLVRIQWNFTPDPNGKAESLPLFGRIYKQNGGRGAFHEINSLKMLSSTGDTISAFHEEEMEPEHLINFYIIPEDIFGNKGFPSDTVAAISIDFNKIPFIENVQVTDSLNGLFCRWDPLPDKPYYTGIQILRSRNPEKDFIVLDTVPSHSTSYFDTQVLSNITYHYNFRPLVYKISGWQEMIGTHIQATTSPGDQIPLPPKNPEAIHEGSDIKLTWDHNTEIDIFAYYVLRGTSSEHMEIVSPAIFDTVWIDTTSFLSGRINYLYSVVAVNENQQMSDLSNVVGIRPDRGEFVQSPDGLSIRSSGEKLILTWPDVARNDAAIAGYILYKKKENEDDFSPADSQIITIPYFEDWNVEKDILYVYSVSAVDRFGYESQRSPETEFILTSDILPPSTFFVRQLSGGIEISWPENTNQDIAEYHIYRRTPDEDEFTRVKTVKANEEFFLDTDFITNELNIYCLTVSNAFRESKKSLEKSIFGNR